MCDCFNLGFPNWHGSLGTGSGRRLKGPEPDTVDDSICEESSEFIEGERPRPQGSSPVDEYPETDKYKDSDKQGGGGSGKKGKRGFGSLFEKRSPAKMSQLENPESGVIVKMAKETCAEGLVVSGGKEGIFIKEVRPESPASKLLSVHEGDQILSATVYFDDVTYEDALQILEHAQPYKMELLLKRKPIKTSTLESEPALEIIQVTITIYSLFVILQVEEGSSPEMRGHTKTKRHGDRISWPKFPSFSKSQKSHFKRSHSTSEADDKRKLELSPTTSDTESPIKSQEAVKGKTKKHKIKLSSMKMKGRKSMSVEQPDQDIDILTVERVECMENQQSQDDIHSPDGLESASVDISQVYVLESESEKIEPTKIRNECIIPDMAGSETKKHKVELISLDKTLKTTDITVALADQESPSTKKSPEGKTKKKENKERMSFPKFGFSKPEVKAPKVDVSLPEGDISLPEENVEVKVPEMKIEAPEIQIEVKDTVGSPTRFKMPTLKFPQFGAAAPNITVEVPDVDKDVKVHGSEIPELKLSMSAINIEKPSVDLKGPSIDVDVKSKRLDIVTLPEASVEVQPPSTELKVPSGKGKIHEGAATEIDVKMRKPRMSFGWFSKPEVKAPEVDVSLPKGDISLPEVKGEVKESEVEIKSPEIQVEMKHGIELEGQGSKFKLPKFGISLPKVKGPEFDLSISKTDVDVNLPERRADHLPDVEVGVPSVKVEKPEAVSKDVDVKMKIPRMSFPKFGFSKPEVKAPKVDVSLPEVDISLPEENVEVKEPEMEIEAPEIQIEVKDTVGSPSRFKMPTLKFPQFGAAAPNITVEVPDVDKDVKVHGSEIPELKLTMSAINIEKGIVDLKGPSIDVDVKSKRLDIVTLPEASVEVQPPSTELKVPSGKGEIHEGAATEIDVKMRKPRMSFGWFSKPEVKAQEVDVSLPKGDISLPEVKVEVKESEVEIKSPEIQVEMKHGIELEGQGSKFKLPKFGISLPKVKGPEFDLSISKTDVDVNLPERRADQLPDVEVGVPSVEVEIPEAVSKDIDVKLKKPRMSFPKFGFSKPEVKAPEVDVSLPEVDISLPEERVEVKEPEVEIEAPEIQIEVKDTVGSPTRFKMPTLKFPQFGAAAPNITVEVPGVNKDVKVHGSDIPELKPTMSAINIEKPSVDLKRPSIDVDVKSKRLDIVTLPEASVEVQPPSTELKVPSGKGEIPEGVATEMDVKMRKPRMSFGWFSKPEVKAPEVDVSLPKGDISLPEVKVEVKESEVEIKSPEIQVEMKHGIQLEGQGSKFKLPKFGISLPKVKGPEFDLSISKTDVDVNLPERRADQLSDVEVGVPSVEVEIPEAVSKDIDVKLKKPRMSFPKFGFSKPEVKAPKVDVSHPEVDISLPEEYVEVKEPEIEIEAPEIQIEVKDTVGSPSRFKMPTLKFPQFGAAAPNITVEVPDVDKDVKVHGSEIPELKLTMSAINIEKPSVDLKGPSIDVDVKSKTLEIVTLPEARVEVQPPRIELKVSSGEVEMPEGAATEIDVKMKKPRMSFGWFSKSEVKSPEVDVSLPEVDISLPEGKVVVKEPEVEMTAPEIQVEVKHDIELEGQGSKFKLPKFGMSLPKVKGPEIDLSLSKKVIDVTLPEDKVEVQPPDVDIEVPSGEIEMPDGAATGIDVIMKIPQMSFGLFSKPEVKPPEVDVSLPKVDISLSEGNVEVKEPEVEMNAPESQVEMKHEGLSVDGKLETSDMGFKMATFKFPKFVATSKVVVDVSDTEKDIKVPGVEIIDQLLGASLQIDLPEHGDTVDIKGSREVQLHDAGSERPSVKGGMAIAEVYVHEVEVSKLTIDDKGHGSPSKGQGSPSKGQGSPSKFKLPTFKMPRLSISKSKPENEHDDINPNVILENYEIQVKPQGPEKSPKLTLTTFGEVLRNIDVEFDVPKLEEVEEKLTGSREDITASGKTELNAQTSVETQSVHKEEEAKEKSKFGWVKFPTFGLSSPSESAKILEKDTSEKGGSEKSPDSVEQDASLTFSVHPLDAFADISSTVTSEQFGPPLASPTKVTVKYSDSIATEVQGDVITSTARTKLIAFEPYLADKVIIPMSSGVSSSSVDTLKLESGTHVSTSNIQAIPDTQKATLLTDFGLQTGTARVSSASWSVDDTNKTQSDGQTVIDRHVVREMSGTDKETVFITQKITHVFVTEPISDETASSIKQIKDTMQSEKMTFFDGAELE
ncbi:neuroblast differentiation-associated protein AHNAK-like [Oncorhynchus masou masou]|uniref:neuroblast differentiation-associated protein AHNAK-like n=1 Tax=Oncorhynchus masou masou TaxID=90313 RepID=UPI0031831F3C